MYPADPAGAAAALRINIMFGTAACSTYTRANPYSTRLCVPCRMARATTARRPKCTSSKRRRIARRTAPSHFPLMRIALAQREESRVARAGENFTQKNGPRCSETYQDTGNGREGAAGSKAYEGMKVLRRPMWRLLEQQPARPTRPAFVRIARLPRCLPCRVTAYSRME
jgi:hypothetical protein